MITLDADYISASQYDQSEVSQRLAARPRHFGQQDVAVHWDLSRCLLCLVVWLLSASALAAEKLQIASPFADGAILQRDVPLPVWGRAEPNTRVLVGFAGQERTAVSDSNGKWKVQLAPLSSSLHGQELAVSAGAESLHIKDVLVGEVWLAFGYPSDALMPKTGGSNEESLDVADPIVRIFEIDVSISDHPRETCRGQWRVPQRSRGIALFARTLREKLGVPVGVLSPSALVPGLGVSAWISRPRLEATGEGKAILFEHEKAVRRFEFVVNDWDKNDGAAMKAERDAYKTQLIKAGKRSGYMEPEPKPDPQRHPNLLPGRPSGAFNGMLSPIVSFAVRGLICSDWESPFMLIDACRDEWQQERLPAMGFWHRNQELDGRVRLNGENIRVPSVGYSDHGPQTDREQKKIKRAALASLAQIYKQNVEWRGPAYDRMTIDGKKVTLYFKHVAGGLTKSAGDFEGFEVRSASGKWLRANAELTGNAVVVSRDDVPDPVQVRFGPNRHFIYELANSEGFVAESFETEVASRATTPDRN